MDELFTVMISENKELIVNATCNEHLLIVILSTHVHSVGINTFRAKLKADGRYSTYNSETGITIRTLRFSNEIPSYEED